VKGKAAIFCMGGHGRTGTALSALAQVSAYAPAIESGDIVTWVREVYCQDAVETQPQIDYLQRVLKVATTATSSRGWGGSIRQTDPKGVEGRGVSKYFKHSNKLGHFDDQLFDNDGE